MSDSQLFDEVFQITSINNDKYDRVSRVYGTSTDSTITMSLDINHELFPVQLGDNVSLVLASTLNLDGSKDEGKGWREPKEATLADMYEYVCHGKVYRFDEGDNGETVKMYASFGGLLLYMEAPYKKVTSCRVEYLYMLCKK
ncbi:UDP-glucose 4-epimerase Gal10 [Amniculicola lignicola CBS 123094]|uniref:DNA-directed RNA polymerases I, II, and III subunit RPABC3 n=1 Tax=Amniculicola lignicola CBS 123094 TaxID=1392246 RepID=A0A6A5VVG1_9PLEO|nr:UDP-glucose 4-epimerase Gal10 [Amniculicola lignicola CBS 123094]